MRKTGICANCYESITNPVCTDCFIREINNWLKNLKIKKLKREEIKKRLKDKIFREVLDCPEEEIDCIICKKEVVSICSYCFFIKASEILKQLNIDKNLKNNFENTFNYR